MSIGIATVWQGLPFFMLMFIAALTTVPGEIYEAAAIDGATAWARFTHITLPSIADVIGVTVMLSTIWTFNNFNIVYILTGGGPDDRTQILPTLAYEYGMRRNLLGQGAAVIVSALPVFLGHHLPADAADAAGERRALMVVGRRKPHAARRWASASRWRVLLLWSLVPVYWILITSFKHEQEIYAYPPTFVPMAPTLCSNTQQCCSTRRFPLFIRNSLIVAGATTLLATAAGALGAFAIAPHPLSSAVRRWHG